MIRPACPDDADGIGAMHATAWAETYPGLVPEGLLAEMTDIPRRRSVWARYLSTPRLPGGTFLAELDGEVAGFITVCPAQSPKLGTTGEVKELYLLRRAQRRRIGTMLLSAGLATLREHGMSSAGAWVACGNKAAELFYEATGARPGPIRIESFEGFPVQQIGWIWDDLSGWP